MLKETGEEEKKHRPTKTTDQEKKAKTATAKKELQISFHKQ